jgi:2-keto-4-pentenoate hydratase/2-oxohepta-3-ene-1,7-dioic acid hydratase (catechol pathway)
MHEVRVRTPAGIETGTLRDDAVLTDTGSYAVGAVEWCVPVAPTAVYCVGRNYATTNAEMGYERPAEPTFFLKPPAALVAHEQPVSVPAFTDRLVGAGELAVVIGTTCRDVAPDDVDAVIRGYTILTDMDARDQPTLSARKVFEAAAPVGPVVTDRVDPAAIAMRTTVDGEQVQAASTAEMLFDVPTVVAALTSRITLHAGDLIAMGGPGNTGVLRPGQTVRVTYEGIGTLETPIA